MTCGSATTSSTISSSSSCATWVSSGSPSGLVNRLCDRATVQNVERLLETATAAKTPVFVSPHYYYPADHEWQFGLTDCPD